MNASHRTNSSGILTAMAIFVLAQSTVAATVAYYRFEDSLGFTKDSAGAADLIDNSVTHVTLPAGGRGGDFSDPIPQTSASNDKAADFDGSTSYFDTGDTGMDLITNDLLTLEAFLHVDSVGSDQLVAAQWDTVGVNERSWQLRLLSGGRFTLFVSDDGSSFGSGTTALAVSAGKDYFIVFTYSGPSESATFYLRNLTDGGIHRETVSISLSPGGVNSDDRMTIGRQVSAGQWYDGLIDELRVSDAILDPVDFLVPVVTATEIYYRIEDSPGFTNDSGSLGISLGTSGSPVQYTLPGSGAGSDFPHPVPKTGTANDKALDCVADADHLLTDDTEYIIFDSDFTLEGFFNPDITTGRRVIAGSWATAGVNARSVMFSVEDGQLSLFLSDNGSGFEFDVSTTLPVSVGNDYYAAVTFDESDQASGITMYLQDLTGEGTLLSQTFSHTISSLYVEDSIIIGAAQGGGNGFRGLIDEVRFSNTILLVSDFLITSALGGTILVFE